MRNFRIRLLVLPRHPEKRGPGQAGTPLRCVAYLLLQGLDFIGRGLHLPDAEAIVRWGGRTCPESKLVQSLQKIYCTPYTASRKIKPLYNIAFLPFWPDIRY